MLRFEAVYYTAFIYSGFISAKDTAVVIVCNCRTNQSGGRLIGGYMATIGCRVVPSGMMSHANRRVLGVLKDVLRD